MIFGTPIHIYTPLMPPWLRLLPIKCFTSGVLKWDFNSSVTKITFDSAITKIAFDSSILDRCTT